MTKEKNDTPAGSGAVVQELKENPYRKFNLAFSLMSIIPFLAFFYLLINRLFTLNILVGDIGLILSITILISLLGFAIGYGIIKNILNKLILYAAQAKKSDQLKSAFVASVSHELKNPLAIVKANLANILDGLVGQINDSQRIVVQMCQGIIDRLNRLIGDLLDLHKIEAGRIEMRRKLCHVTELLEKQVKEFDVLLSRKGINLTREIITSDINIWGDEDKIMQVFNNLLSNAVKYTPDGGKIIVRIFPVDGYVRMEVSDTGKGIPQDKLTNIFNKFERADREKEGTGLGLYITKDIVELHRGRIWAESGPGEGSKFIVVMPRDLRSVAR